MKMIFIFAFLLPAISFGKTDRVEKPKAKRVAASAVDAKVQMLAAFNLLQRLSDASVLPPATDLQNTVVTIKVQQKAGGYYLHITLKGPEISNTLNCSAPLQGATLDFDQAICERVLGG